MNIFPADLKVLVYQKSVSMRFSFSGLSLLVESELRENPLSGQLFVFFNRSRNYVKILYWEEGGYCLWSKRLEVGTYRLARTESEISSLSVTELRMILDGFELSNYRRRKRYKFEENNLPCMQ